MVSEYTDPRVLGRHRFYVQEDKKRFILINFKMEDVD